MDNDPNGVTWLPAWKRHGYASYEAWIESKAGASPPDEPCAACGKPATGLAYFNDERFCHGDDPGASCYEKQQWAYSYWPQEQPPPYAADDEDDETPHG